MRDTYKKLTKVFREVFDDDSIELTPETTANDIDDWDSIEHINLIAAVEDAFGMRFQMREVSAMKNVGEMFAFVSAMKRRAHPLAKARAQSKRTGSGSPKTRLMYEPCRLTAGAHVGAPGVNPQAGSNRLTFDPVLGTGFEAEAQLFQSIALLPESRPIDGWIKLYRPPFVNDGLQLVIE